MHQSLIDLATAETAATVLPCAFSSSRHSEGNGPYLRDRAIGDLLAFFEAKGVAALKQEELEEKWYDDWVAYQAGHRIYASVLSLKRFSSLGNEFNIRRLARFAEVFAYLSPAHGYSFQVSLLGLLPIYLGSNDELKQQAVAALEAGGLFAFGVSERAHGSDLFANEFELRGSDGMLIANGSKYYIGNANAATFISILAKQGEARSRRVPFVLFALRAREPGSVRNLRKIRTLGIRSAFVGAFDVCDHPVPRGDVISEGRRAWDSVFGTVTLGKFILGFGSIGISERAMDDARAHLAARVLFGKPVAEMPHIQSLVTRAWVRLAAMKLFAYRALDYFQCASATDRRYLMFSAVQKAKVSTEGVRVVEMLSECMGAKGFEAEEAFESVLRDIKLIPALEGSTHINCMQLAQYMKNYFAGNELLPAPFSGGLRASAGENPYLMEAKTAPTRSVAFGAPAAAFNPLSHLPNVRLFLEQHRAFAHLAADADALRRFFENGETAIALGKCVATIAYAQLIAEAAVFWRVPDPLVSLIFASLVEDLSLAVIGFPFHRCTPQDRPRLRGTVRVPETVQADFQAVVDVIASCRTGFQPVGRS